MNDFTVSFISLKSFVSPFSIMSTILYYVFFKWHLTIHVICWQLISASWVEAWLFESTQSMCCGLLITQSLLLQVGGLTANQAAAQALKLFRVEAELCETHPSKVPRTLSHTSPFVPPCTQPPTLTLAPHTHPQTPCNSRPPPSKYQAIGIKLRAALTKILDDYVTARPILMALGTHRVKTAISKQEKI